MVYKDMVEKDMVENDMGYHDVADPDLAFLETRNPQQITCLGPSLPSTDRLARIRQAPHVLGKIFIINSLRNFSSRARCRATDFPRTLERHLRNSLTFAAVPSRIHSSSGLWLEFQAFVLDKSLKLSNFAVCQRI